MKTLITLSLALLGPLTFAENDNKQEPLQGHEDYSGYISHEINPAELLRRHAPAAGPKRKSSEESDNEDCADDAEQYRNAKHSSAVNLCDY